MRKNRGFVLILALLLTSLLVVLGLAFLGKKAVQYRLAARAQVSAQARALAEAGLADFQVKLERDLNFPPIGVDQQFFAYREELRDGSKVIGSYAVEVNAGYQDAGYSLYVVTCVGEAGESDRKTFARRAIRVEVDMSRMDRNDKKNLNADYRRIVNYEDLGSL